MTKQDAITRYRREHPRARRTNSTAIVHSGSKQTVYDCVCGAQHTAATRYRGETKHEREWLAEHSDCVVKLYDGGD